MCEIRKYEKQLQSQFGEAGIILEVLKRINKKGSVVEIGAGFDCGNCYELASQGWTTLFVDASEEYINKLKIRFGHLPNVSYVAAPVSKYNINKIVPSDTVFISIDIDGNDYWIWEALKSNPLFVVVEINSAFPPPEKKVVKYNENQFWDGTNYYGASLSAFCELAKSKNYILIGTDSRQLNAYFVHKSVGHLFKEETPENVWFTPNWAHPNSNKKMLNLDEIKSIDINLEDLKIYKPNFEKIRLGRSFDGGYVMCKMGDYDCFISGGIAGDVSFEESFLEHNPALICYAFDGTVDFQNRNNLVFTKKNIGSKESENETNLHDFLNNYKNIFVKLDIEGSEYDWMTSVSDLQLQNIKQLLIEIHQPFDKEKWTLLSRLAQTHWLVHLHGNNCGVIDGSNTIRMDNVTIPNTFECTYIRKSDVKGLLKPNRLKIPTEIDKRNEPTREDIELKGYPYQDTTMCYGNFKIYD
jgi:Methyltransferase FkbM domain